MRHPPPDEVTAATFRIGEVAKLTGLTTRALRYWEELGLIRPGAYQGRGERRYTQTDMARVTRIRELQELGFSLAEVRVVLDMEDIDVLDRVRSEYRWGGAGAERRLALLDEAIEANDKLLARLDSTLGRLGAFRDERVETAARLRAARDTLVDELGPRRGSPRLPSRPAPAAGSSGRTASSSPRRPGGRLENGRQGNGRQGNGRVGKDRVAKDRVAKDRVAKDRVAKDRARKDRAATDRAATDRARKDRAATDRAATDRAAKDRAAKYGATQGRSERR